MNKRILLIGYNYYPEPTGIGKYSGEMIQWLAQNGYDCTVITTYPYYPYWQVQEPYRRKRFWYSTERENFASGGRITVHRCPIYVPANPSGPKRVLLDFSFLASAWVKLVQLLSGPGCDYVVTIAPSFILGVLGIFYKSIRRTKFLYHIHDLQIEAARDLNMIKSSKIIESLFKLENYIFRQCDVITSISEGMVHKIQQKTSKQVQLFPNWADISLFYPIEDKAALKSAFGFKPTDKILLYSGAIGEKQGLEAILHAADTYRAQSELKFIICGSGPYKEKLQQLAEELNLSHVIFFPLQSFERFNRFLNLADVHLVIQKANAGDLVMPSKLTTILAVGGLAVITANPNSGMYSLVSNHHMALLVEAENQHALNDGIRQAITGSHHTITRNARQYAENHLSISHIMTSYETLLN